MRFNVCLLQDSIHTQCFAEMADSVAWALRELGHDVVRLDKIDISAGGHPINVVFGLRPDSITARMANELMPRDAIIFNGEQASGASIWPALVPIYKRFRVWDYSSVNAARYADYGLDHPGVVRPGYSPALDRIPKKDKDYEFVFVGSVNERRRKILDDLESAGMRVLVVPFGLYGRERDALVARAKFCINVHFYENAIFESLRCGYLAQNGIPVLSEKSTGGEAKRWGIQEAPYNGLVDMARLLMDGLDVMSEHQKMMARKASLLDDVSEVVAKLSDGQDDAVGASGEQEFREFMARYEQEVSAALSGERLEKYRSSEGIVGTSSDGKQGVDANPNDVQYGRVMEAGAPSTRQRVTLSMIVKNEAAVIRRCLASVKPWLTGWSIVDTGSTDGTQEIIREFMKDIPGTLHELPWKEFDGSRNDALDLARVECSDQGWLMLIDADEQLCGKPPSEINGEGHDGYYVWVSRCEKCARWVRPFLIRASKPWFYEMPRHEGLYCRVNAPLSNQPMDQDGIYILSGTDGGRAQENSYDRFMRDARVLEQWSLSHPNHTRCQYYIAQSYRDAATGKMTAAADGTRVPDRAAMQKAAMHYQRRADMVGGWDEETWSALFESAKAMSACGYPFERVQQMMLRAFDLRPTRIEPLHALATHYREHRMFSVAEMFARRAARATKPDDKLYVDPGIYAWHAKEELAVSLTYLNGHSEALALNLGAIQVCPEDQRSRIQENIDMCIRHLSDQEK